MKELLDSFKTEMMERFQKQEDRIGRQEEKNVEQDVEIARQSDTISKLEETIAEQKKIIEDQNETIQMIATYPGLRDLHHALQTPSPRALNTSTTTLSPPQDSLLFITGHPFLSPLVAYLLRIVLPQLALRSNICNFRI